MGISDKKFTVYDSEATSVLQLINEVGLYANELHENLDQKTDLYGDHLGTWQGLERPTLSDEGLRATVEDIIDNKIPSIEKRIDNNLVVNILDYGATGKEDDDKVADILVELLNNIDGDSITIKFPRGVYNLTREIELPYKTVKFIGDGVGETTIINSSGKTFRSFFYKRSDNNKRYNSFTGIHFDCNKKVNRAIYFERGNGTGVYNCKFTNHLQSGIWFEAIDSMTGAVIYESEIVGNYFRGVEGGVNNNTPTETMPQYNIYLGSGATDSILRDNISVNAKIHLYVNGGNNMIRDNHFFDYPVPQYNSQAHIQINGTSSIMGNYFDSPVCGIRVTGERIHISHNNFFWGVETIDRTNFVGIDINITKERQRGIVIQNNFFNPIGSTVGYDIKVTGSLELPFILNNRSMNITNIYQSLIMYSDGTTRKVNVNGDIETTGQFIGKFSPNVGIIPTKTGIIMGNSTTPFKQLTTEHGLKCNMDNYNLSSFPSSIVTGYQDIMNLIKNLGDRVKVLESR